MHAKNASMSASVPTSPSQLKSADPHAGGQVYGTGLNRLAAVTVPGSPRAASLMVSVHVPSHDCPLNAESSPPGRYVPLGTGSFWITAVANELDAPSANVYVPLRLRLLLIPPGRFMIVTVVALCCSIATRSPTHECTRPSVSVTLLLIVPVPGGTVKVIWRFPLPSGIAAGKVVGG